ncbi:hypothetical protein ALC56_06718 [Trachymyrmex septentrionalis]|uniref:Uncharacterized protein n=1 Tax=Trachymyrmex septentrionalis TaxID=34720 RepID=A0A195FFC1_9HYME|nr:hypothetical protein ALC56_06718 [Trachymyrmex septentrionalis]
MLRRSYHLGVRTYRIREAVVLYIGLEAEDERELYCGERKKRRKNERRINKFLTRIRPGACYPTSSNHPQREVQDYSDELFFVWFKRLGTRRILTVNDDVDLHYETRRRENGSSSSSRYDKGREGRRLWHSCFVEPSNPAWTGTGCCETGASTTIALLAFRDSLPSRSEQVVRFVHPQPERVEPRGLPGDPLRP